MVLMIEITLKAVPKLCVPGDGGGGMITTGALVASLAAVLVLLILLFHNISLYIAIILEATGQNSKHFIIANSIKFNSSKYMYIPLYPLTSSLFLISMTINIWCREPSVQALAIIVIRVHTSASCLALASSNNIIYIE